MYDSRDCIDEDICEEKDCDTDDIGDNVCDVECNHPECSYDLGDCKVTKCAEDCPN